MTLYGHVNTWLVSIGQRVMAGDQIATIGNRGNSTGPHLHFEVLLNGTDRIDPVPWLASAGRARAPDRLTVVFRRATNTTSFRESLRAPASATTPDRHHPSHPTGPATSRCRHPPSR